MSDCLAFTRVVYAKEKGDPHACAIFHIPSSWLKTIVYLLKYLAKPRVDLVESLFLGF